jgi:hypothetical protein
MLGGESEDTINNDPIIKSCPNNLDNIDDPDPNDDSMSKHDNTDIPNTESNPGKPVFHPEDLVGRSFLMDTQQDGQKHRATIRKMIEARS